MTTDGGTSPESAVVSAIDLSLPFIVDNGSFRGRLVRLTRTVTDVLDAHKDPEPVGKLMAEAMVAAVSLASGLKYDGVFTLQVQGNGPVETLVTDVTSTGDVRGYVKFDADRVTVEMAKAHPHLLGAGGHLVFTVDQGPETERFQGIVELSGEGIADAVHTYFRQSEQIDSALKMAVAPPVKPGDGWRAAAIVLQRLPEKTGEQALSKEDAEDAWRTVVILLGSLKDQELLDWSIAPERLLTRLYATVGVLPMPRRPMQAKCRCSYERSERILASFPVDEVRSYAQDGKVHMTCEFCRTDYVFTESQLEAVAAKRKDQPKDSLP